MGVRLISELGLELSVIHLLCCTNSLRSGFIIAMMKLFSIQIMITKCHIVVINIPRSRFDMSVILKLSPLCADVDNF